MNQLLNSTGQATSPDPLGMILAHLDRMQTNIDQYQQGVQIEVKGVMTSTYLRPDSFKDLSNVPGTSMIRIDTAHLPIDATGPNSSSHFYVSSGQNSSGEAIRVNHLIYIIVLRGSITIKVEGFAERTIYPGGSCQIPKGAEHSWQSPTGMLLFAQWSPAVEG